MVNIFFLRKIGAAAGLGTGAFELELGATN